ncbi:MAG: hypothetical protein ACSHXF_04470 [Aquaticitalea sp.]
MQNPSTFDSLVQIATETDLYQKLILQINKDLLLANINLQFDPEVLPSSLKLMLHETIFKLIQEKFTEYLNLLYIVDVSEDKIRQLDGNDTLQLSEQVTFLLLKREWQKIWFRNKF